MPLPLFAAQLETREICALQSQPFAAKRLICKGNRRSLLQPVSTAGSQLLIPVLIQRLTPGARRLARRLQLYL